MILFINTSSTDATPTVRYVLNLQRGRCQEDAGAAPSPRDGRHPDLPLRHARAPDEGLAGVVGRAQRAIDERELDPVARAPS